MADLTAIVLTKNEEKNLPDCLSSLRGFAARVVVVDSGSADRTVEIAREYGADVYAHLSRLRPPVQLGAGQCRRRTEWVLRIDADERMTEAVKAECAPILATGAGERRLRHYHGGQLLHARPAAALRRGEKAQTDDLPPRLRPHRGALSWTSTRCSREGRDVRIRARFDHYDFKSVGHFANKLVWYSGREVMDVLGAAGGDAGLQNAGIRRTRKLKTGLYYRLPRFFRVLCIFLFRYIVQLGFLDGVPGLIYHFMYSFMYRFLVDAKLYEAQKTGKYDTTITALEAKD